MPRHAIRIIATIAVLALLSACGSSRVVREGGSGPVRPGSSVPRPGQSVTVQRGDTLYRIATSNGVSALDLATWNGIAAPYTIYPGQRLRLYPGGATASRPSPTQGSGTTRPSSGTAATPPPAPVRSNIAWRWPADGQLISRFTEGDPTRQGIGIAGTGGQAVRAAGDGVVVYSGSGLVGYGELIIVKHNDQWLTAYGHNRKRLVSEGAVVKAGQQIGEMGSTGATRNMLHFEIRLNGKPVDPQLYLPRK